DLRLPSRRRARRKGKKTKTSSAPGSNNASSSIRRKAIGPSSLTGHRNLVVRNRPTRPRNPTVGNRPTVRTRIIVRDRLTSRRRNVRFSQRISLHLLLTVDSNLVGELKES